MNKESYKSFAANGYCIFDNLIDPKLIDEVNNDIDSRLLQERSGALQIKKNPSIYHYNDNPRIIEAWKWSENVREISLNKDIMNFLRNFYEKNPIPFSTINFLKASEQPLHSDYLHFGSIPDGYLVGVWVALEDVHHDAGPLLIAKGSNADPYFSLEKLNLSIPTSLEELKTNNTKYEEYLQKRIQFMNYEVIEATIKKGSVLLWQANVFHGSKKIKNQNLTRKSQVTHYQFEGTKHYNPNYSLPTQNKYAYRDLSKFDIRNKNNYEEGVLYGKR